MKHHHRFALAVLSTPLLLALATPGERIAFTVPEGTTLSKTFTSSNNMSMDDMTQVVNGEEMDMSMLGGMEMSMEMTQTVQVVDSYEAVRGDRPMRLKRSFEKLSSDMQMDSPMMAGMGGGDSMEGSSELEGLAVLFEWNEESSEYDITFAGDDDADGELLEDLIADMDLRAFLPQGEVAEGETWEIPTEALIHIMAPGGNLKIMPDGDMAGMGMPGAGNPYDALGDFEGTFTGKYVGTREVDGARVAVIELEVDASSTKDMTEMLAEMMEDMDMGEGMPEVSYDSVDMEMEFSGTGELLWDLAGGHIHSLEISGDALMAMDMAYSMSMGGQEMDMETSIEMSGTQSLSVSVGATE